MPWRQALVYPLWIIAVFYAVQVALGGLTIGDDVAVPGLLQLLMTMGVPLDTVAPPVMQTVLVGVVFVAVLGIVLWLPKQLGKDTVTLSELGLTRLLSWLDIGIGLLAVVPYMMVAGVLIWAVDQLIPGFNIAEQQDVGFSAVRASQLNYILAFVTLVVVAPVAEEILFRGYLYGKLRRLGLVAAALVTSVAFAFLHGQWNVALDVFVLSLVLCGLREITGSIWAGVVLHMTKNSIAYFYLFVVPVLIH